MTGIPDQPIVAPLGRDPTPSTPLERVARSFCATNVGGFCLNVGGDLGCKNGRGLAPHWRNCVASRIQLDLSGNSESARAAIAALNDTSTGSQGGPG